MKLNLYYAPCPVQKFEEKLDYLSTQRSKNPKSALTTLASGIRLFSEQFRLNVDIEIIDLQLGSEERFYKKFTYGPKELLCYGLGYPFEKFEAKYRETSIHGISSNFTNGAQLVADLAKYIKKVNPGSLVIVGGTDATFRPGFYLENGADMVIKGEGEYTFTRVLDAYVNKKDFAAIPNVCVKNGSYDDKIDKSALLDMNILKPMALDLVYDLYEYGDTGEGMPPDYVEKPYVCFETSRGCYNNCSFCTTPAKGKYRYMTVDSVKKHFDYFKSKGIKTILFQEDNVLSRIQRNSKGEYIYPAGREDIIEIFKLAREYRFSWEFANGLEFGKLFYNNTYDYALCEALLWNEKNSARHEGCYRVQIPIENLSDDADKKFPKLKSFSQQLEILKTIAQYGITYHNYNVIIGYPEDSAESLDNYISKCFTIKNELHKSCPDYNPYFNIFTLALLPGTADYKNFNSRLKFNIDRHPEVVSMYIPSMDTNSLSYYEVFLKRAAMNHELNGRLIEKYDGNLIYI